MARLRKASSPTEPCIIPPPATAPGTSRTSPRKTLRETPSTRELRYTSQESEESILVPKIPAGSVDTPRKQRILRPVASNSRLLRKLSDESLATPERRVRERENGLGFLYSRSLAKTVARRGVGKAREREDKSCDLSGEPAREETAVYTGTNTREKAWEHEDGVHGIQNENQNEALDDSDEDEDPVVDVKNRKRHGGGPPKPPSQPLESDEEAEMDSVQRESQREGFHASPEAKPSREMLPPLTSMRPPHRKGRSTISNWAQGVIDLTSSPESSASYAPPPLVRPDSVAATSRPTSSSCGDAAALLQYSPTPTKHRSPRKEPPLSRPRTPSPPRASPSKLVSPSKKKNCIPDAPDLRPSLEAFWSAEVVNAWNESHSPAKRLISPRKQKWLKELQELDDESSDDDTPYVSPTVSPRKKTSSSPTKTTAVSSPNVADVRAQRKAFSSARHSLAEAFLAEIDATINDGRIASMSKDTGGIKLVWSKTLKTTAGRANWRREQLRLRTGPLITDIRVEYRHHCSIELAEKVIDDEERLYNVLAHEYCHLATFMISEVRNNPHGAEFKSWAAKVSRAFMHKGVEVTTKHSYQIAYKYVWECITCGYEFKRHSKSVDPTRHSCGRCKGKLVQTKPTPRGGKVGGQPKEKSEYQVFVKANFSKVKKRLEEEGKDAQLGKVMAVVAEEYQMQKNRKAESGTVEVEELFEGLRIEDNGM